MNGQRAAGACLAVSIVALVTALVAFLSTDPGPDRIPGTTVPITITTPQTSPPAESPRPTATRAASRSRRAATRVNPTPQAASPGKDAHDGRHLSGPGVPAHVAALHWDRLAHCESTSNPRAVSDGGTYRGLYQFDRPTWRSVGGLGDPIDASPAEQTYRAQLLYLERGRRPWPYCGRFL